MEERLEHDVPQAKLRVAFCGNHFQMVPYGSAADAGLKDPPAEALEVPHTGHFLLVALNWKPNPLISFCCCFYVLFLFGDEAEE